MRPTAGEGDAVALWDVATPVQPHRVAGVTMAGFRDLGRTPAGLRLIPHPAVTVAVIFGGGTIAVADASGRQHRGNLVGGLGLGFGSVRLERAENFQCLQVRLSPLVARAVLGVSPAELDGAVVALDDLWGRQSARLAEQLEDASCWEDRFALVDALLARNCESRPPVERPVAWAWTQIVRSGGRARIDPLAADLGWSRKRLWTQFQAQIGLPPKRAAKLVRFDQAAHRLVAGLDIAQIAADGGYTDQSHLHRDVVAFTGVTPATLSSEPFLTIDDIAWPDQGQARGTRHPSRTWSRPAERGRS